MKSKLKIILAIALMFAVSAPEAVQSVASATTVAAEKKPAAKSKKKGAAKPAVKRETSASVKKKQASVHQEIKQTRQKIEANENEVTRNLALLADIEHDINVQQNRISTLESREKQLISSIAEHERKIEEGEKNLKELRERYIAAVKKMRLARRRMNPMAFIFSSKSFYQAWRRMRYMHKFTEWRTKKEVEIRSQIASLEQSHKKLSGSQTQLKNTLAAQQDARAILDTKYEAQNVTVATLKAAGDVLRNHLAQKQAEANELNNRVSALIAAEQEEARQAEIRRNEQAKRAAAEKVKKEKEAAAKAERQRLAAEKAAKEKAAAEKLAKEKLAKEKLAKENAAKETAKGKKENPKKENPKKETPKQETQKPQTQEKESNKSYAQARGRRPRNKVEGNTAGTTVKKESTRPEKPKREAPKQEVSTPETSNKEEVKKETPKTTPRENTQPSTGSGFAARRGSLPRPVSGQFNIISRFGRHALPGMKDVMYDNPGIDAVTTPGAAALAVFPGTVTGVYVLDGYSTVIIVSHGEYYTVYGNIGKPMVKKGDKVVQGQALGHIVPDPDEGGRTVIHFEVRKGREKLNPEAWIK